MCLFAAIALLDSGSVRRRHRYLIDGYDPCVTSPSSRRRGRLRLVGVVVAVGLLAVGGWYWIAENGSSWIGTLYLLLGLVMLFSPALDRRIERRYREQTDSRGSK